jgi:ubiquitin-conjugating enzyme E2 C
MSLMMSPTPGISAFPAGTDMTKWNATMEGPAETPYEGLTLKLKISFPTNYPMVPPEMLFRTPIYHPNVDMSGRICLDILKQEAWSPSLNTSSVLLSVQSLLGEPNK